MRNAEKILSLNLNSAPGRRKRSWRNKKNDLIAIGYEGVNWIQLPRDMVQFQSLDIVVLNVLVRQDNTQSD